MLVGREAGLLHGDWVTARLKGQADLSGLHPEGGWEDKWVRELVPQKGVGKSFWDPGWEAVGWRPGE